MALAEYVAARRQTADKCLRGLRRDIDLPTLIFHAQDEGKVRIIDALTDALERSEMW